MSMSVLRQHPLLFATIALALVLGGAGIALWRLWRRLMRSEQERRRAAEELNRRLSELFSLQELSYVLSDSIELDRIVEQVVHYAVRLLDAQGALLALLGDGPDDPLRVAAAEGTLSDLRGRTIHSDDAGLLVRSTSREHLELIQNSGTEPTEIVQGFQAAAAAAVPLRSHGTVIGTLLITDPREGMFVPEDIRLLSTLATHASVVIANARFFEMVRRAKDQWETAFDALSEGIAVVDDEGCVRRANRALASLLGMPLQNVLGTPLASALLGKSNALHELLAATRRGERPAPLVARSEPLALETQLVQSEKLAAVGQLVSGVAHELNNPLTSIAGLSEFLLEQKELGTKDRGHLRVIHEQADRAGRIVRNLLTFAHKGPAEQAPVDLNDVIQRTLILMSYDLKLKDVTIEKHLAPLPAVLGDRRALQQVVLNLLNNAAQAVTTNPPGRPQVIHLSTWFDDRVRLRVADTGPGIPDDVLPQLFTPFFTTKEPGQGTGLGLSITYSIVEAHGGRITVERPSDGGAAFLVDLPAAPAAAAAAPRKTPEPQAAPAVKRTILLVDDDPAVRRMVKALFGREGHSVEVARSGQHALDLARTRGYDLILADAQAPARDRLFVEQLVETQPDLRDRVLVGLGDVPPPAEKALARLGVRYVRKPFNLRDLRDEAARVWAAATLS